MNAIRKNPEAFVMTIFNIIYILYGAYHFHNTRGVTSVIWLIGTILLVILALWWLYQLFDLTVDIAHIKYTWEHKIAFIKVEKQLTGKVTLRGILHDVDKLFLYLFLDGERVSKIHRSYSRHHIIKAHTEKDFIQMVIDWECGRITKPDKPLNAYETLYFHYPQLEDNILPLLKRFGIAKTRGGAIYC